MRASSNVSGLSSNVTLRKAYCPLILTEHSTTTLVIISITLRLVL